MANRSGNRATPQDLPSIITVEVIGYGGGETGPGQPQERRHQQNAQSGVATGGYDRTAAVQILGAGMLAPAERKYLTQAEKSRMHQD
ncbi:MAG TPA: hypothetical protein VL574_13395 [Stellaceae bacterium]|nr:hypothetical protein [Stellaceae bacterium]